MADVNVKSSGGIGAMGVLGIILILLKAFGVSAVAGWSWWIVLMPFWIGIAIVLAFLLLIGILAGFAALVD